MTASNDVFIVSASCAVDPAQALRQAMKASGVNPARVQDFIFGAETPVLISPDELARETMMNCPVVMVSSSMRAVFFAAQSILCQDTDLVLVGGGQGGQSAGLLLASPASVGIYNLMPLARVDARSLTSAEHALKKAACPVEEVTVRLNGTCGVLLLAQLIEQLQEQKAGWGLAQVGKAALLLERI
jgi:hypothetical protein